MTERHTPGPWGFGNTNFDDRILILGDGGAGKYVCSVQIHQVPRSMGAHQEGERRANASLIKAAPMLLRTLQMVECVYRKNCVTEGEPSSVLAEMQAVIAQATGEG